jgi:hypothetical protein
MFNIRRGLYETNSSSTHCFVIKVGDFNIPKKVTLSYSCEYDWTPQEANGLDYVWALYASDGYDRQQEFIDMLFDWGVEEVKVGGNIITKDYEQFPYINSSMFTIGHQSDYVPSELENDHRLLKCLLFGVDSYVWCSNDNGGAQYPNRLTWENTGSWKELDEKNKEWLDQMYKDGYVIIE